jgi:hypothetical protein
MDQVARFRQVVKAILNQYHTLDQSQPTPGIQSFCAFDEIRDHYFLGQVGWDRTGRTCANTVYIRISEGKIWVEEDMTEDGITQDLLEAGISRQDIILGFQHPQERSLGELAIA